jgi:spore maturation protein CgeB
VEAGIARLLANDEEAKRLGDAGRQRILNGFTPEKRVELIRRVIAS